MVKGKRRKLGGVVYVLPNLLTTGNLFFGFFSIVQALHGHFMSAAVAIFVAAIFDVLDGRVARLTGGTSEFGVQYDSLCDLVSFGVAPAFLMYLGGGLVGQDRLGWIVCFVFLACGALRLARFNVQSSIGKANGDFTGLPIPMAAAVVACFVAATQDLGSREYTNQFFQVLQERAVEPSFRSYFFLVAGPCLGLLMVSNFNYRSHKSLRVLGIRPFRLLVLAVAITALIAMQPELIGFVFFFAYAVSGPIEWIFGRKPVDDDEIFSSEDELEDHEIASH